MSRKLTIDIKHIQPREGDKFGYQISNNGEYLNFLDGQGWDKTFVNTGSSQVDLVSIGKFNSDLSIDNIYENFNGPVLNVAVQTDGKIICVGDFTTYNGISAPRIIRFNTDGTRNDIPNITTGPNGPIKAITLGSGNEIYVGGDFTSFNGVNINRICRLNTSGTVNSTFVANVMSASSNKGFITNDSVRVLRYYNGGLYIGGKFNLFNNTPRNRILRLNSDGTEDTSFNAGAGFSTTVNDFNTVVNFITFLEDNILIGGSFNRYKNTTNVNNIVKITHTGVLDSSFASGAVGTGTNGTVSVIKVDTVTSSIYIGGSFTHYRNNYSLGIVKTNYAGDYDSLFGNGFDLGGSVNDILIGTEIVVVGGMVGYQGVITGNAVTINKTSGLLIDNLRLNATVSKVLASGVDYVLFGSFTQFTQSGGSSNSFYSIPLPPELIVNLGTGFNDIVNKVFKNPVENNFIFMGNFTTYKGATANKVCKISPDGTLISTFAGYTDNLGNKGTVLEDGSMIFGGLGTVNGLDLSTVGYIAKFNNDYTVDATFNSGENGFTDGGSESIYNLKDNKVAIYVSGTCTYNDEIISSAGAETLFIIENDGTFSENIIQSDGLGLVHKASNDDYVLFRNGGVSPNVTRIGELSFNKNLNASYGAIMDNGNLLLAGTFNPPFVAGNLINDNYGVVSNSFAVINKDATQLVYSNPGVGVDNPVKVYQYNGKIYCVNQNVGTPVTSYNGDSVGIIFRLNEDLTLDTTFNLGVTYSGGGITELNFRPDNIIVVGGFTSLNGSTADGIALLDYDGNIISTILDIVQITQNTFDNLEEFNLNGDITYSIVDNVVKMEYVFENDEIVIEELYDTPEHVELTYTNESLTLKDLIDEIVVRSPYLIISQDVDFDTVNYEVKIFEGNLFDADSYPVLYSLTKQKLIPSQENVYININNLVRENLESIIGNFTLPNTDASVPSSDNLSKWVVVEETYLLEGVEVNTRKKNYFAVDGFLYNTEDNILPKVLIYGDKRYVNTKQSQRIYFQSNNLVSITKSINFGGIFSFESLISFDENLVLDNKLYIQSFKVDGLQNSKYVNYSFLYNEDGVDEIINIKIYPYSDCQYPFYNLVYKNKWGVLESLPLSRKSFKELSISSESLNRSIIDYNGSYNINKHTKKQFNTNGSASFTLNTSWLPEYMNQAIEEAMLSEEVWLINESNEIIPVVRKDSSIAFKTSQNDKLIQYTVKFEMSHSTIKNIL